MGSVMSYDTDPATPGGDYTAKAVMDGGNVVSVEYIPSEAASE
jgi:hypothetical protein